MTPLSPASVAAIARLRAYVAPPTQWYNCPLARRAAVLILLFPDSKGDLRVVLTMRSNSLRNYAGQAALPGGKADTLNETPFHVARREAFEEIGLPFENMKDGGKLPKGFKIEHLAELPSNLAKTELGVRPCVALLSTTSTSTSSLPSSQSTTGNPNTIGSNTSSSSSSSSTAEQQSTKPPRDIETTLIPVLDAKEVSAVFSAPFHSFLLSNPPSQSQNHHHHTSESASHPGTKSETTGVGVEAAGFPPEWYRGTWTDWHESRWRMHNFYVPVQERRNVTRPGPNTKGSNTSSPSSSPESAPPIPPGTSYRVFGMTARILVDAARVSYGEEPEFEHNSHFGDEDMIGRLLKIGRMGEVKRKGEVLTREVLREAGRAKI